MKGLEMQELIRNAQARALDLLKPTNAQLEHGLELHRESVVVDSFGFAPYARTGKMVETLNRLIDEGWSAQELSEKSLELRVTEQGHDPEAREQYETIWRTSGVTATLQNCGGGGPVNGMIRHFARFFYVWDQIPEVVQQATRPEDVHRAKAEGRHCQILSMNGLGGHMDGYDRALDMVDTWYHFGVRMMHLTYNQRNLIGDGCTERANGGLSEFGWEVVEKMNRAGILVDTPHSGRQTTLDAASVSSAPIAASHTGCCSVYYHDRGKTDEEIRAIAESGGYIGICCIPTFLAEAGTIVDLLDHIDYAVKLAGVDHVGIGTDKAFMPPPATEIAQKPFPKSRGKVRGWRPEHRVSVPGVSEEATSGSLAWVNWPYFTVGLVQRGYRDSDIQKIVGGNFLRVLGEVARHAGRA